jgi:hypothetical protein
MITLMCEKSCPWVLINIPFSVEECRIIQSHVTYAADQNILKKTKESFQ